MGFVALNAAVDRPHDDIAAELAALIRADRTGGGVQAGLVVEPLPKTRSGKILRGTMRQIADGETWKMPATIDDPLILDEIGGALADVGYPKG